MSRENAHPEVQVVFDMQYGSTGKGAIVGRIAQDWKPDAVATGWGTNAGHTMITERHGTRVATQVASAAVVESVQAVFVGGGSMINPYTFIKELDEVQAIRRSLGVAKVHVFIANTAAIILPSHEKQESSMVGIGSTMKGNGAALVQKVLRNPLALNVAGNTPTPLQHRDDISIVTMSQYVRIMAKCYERVLVEGAQGFSLGLNQQFYPYCTSRECTPQQICTEAGVPVHWVTKRIGCLRTFPIRVANRYDGDKQVGWSGGIYSDQHEVTFDEIEQPVELTTVTKLPRRIFTFSEEQTYDALLQCAPDEIFLNFVNYCTDEQFVGIMRSVTNAANRAGLDSPIVRYFGVDASSDTIIDTELSPVVDLPKTIFRK